MNNPFQKYRCLPYGKSLKGDDLKVALTVVFLAQAKNAEKLCYHSTSNPVESFNRMVAAKAPKYVHNSKSESFDYRLAASVSQKNIGEQYISSVNSKLTMQPCKVQSLLGKKERTSKTKEETKGSIAGYKKTTHRT